MTENEAKQYKPRALENFSEAEKLSEFDRIFRWAKETLAMRQKEQRDKDQEHYCFEMIMELLDSDSRRFWDVWNALPPNGD